MGAAYVTLDGYVVKRATEKAVGLAKASEPFGELTWLPRSACTDGDTLGIGDTECIS